MDHSPARSPPAEPAQTTAVKSEHFKLRRVLDYPDEEMPLVGVTRDELLDVASAASAMRVLTSPEPL